jgi:hypothetical protein
MRFSLVLLSLLVSSSLIAQKPSDAAQWIDGLKNTPADELGTGLPHEKFAVWFADLVKPNEIVYQVDECHVYTPADGATDQLFCVNAYTKPPHPGGRSWIQLSFIVNSIPPVRYIFQRGSEAPANPKMARPSHVFSELNHLEGIVSASHPRNTADLGGRPT